MNRRTVFLNTRQMQKVQLLYQTNQYLGDLLDDAAKIQGMSAVIANYIKNYQAMTRDDDIVFFKVVLYELYDQLEECIKLVNCELLPMMTQKFMLYFQSQDVELLELLLYCLGYTLQMLYDNDKDFSSLSH